MKKVIAVAILAFALIGSAPRMAMAICLSDVCPPPSPSLLGAGRTASLGAGPWVVGGIVLSALSVILRAAVVSNQQHRELTQAEATAAVFLPFFWTTQMAETQMSFNLQYLQLQSQMQAENRSYSAISNIMTEKRKTTKNSISNIR